MSNEDLIQEHLDRISKTNTTTLEILHSLGDKEVLKAFPDWESAFVISLPKLSEYMMVGLGGIIAGLLARMIVHSNKKFIEARIALDEKGNAHLIAKVEE